ncbi:MAG: type III pantothenate kinase [candidate division Zixibacteria bacterium]|nr:type III pantothenate kinase [candidate division Zixibacteria bacterium]
MILLFDIGNSSSMIGLADGEQILGHFKIISKGESDYSLDIDMKSVAAQIVMLAADSGKAISAIEDAAVCSVVPELTLKFCDLAKQYFGIDAWVLDHRSDLGLKVQVDEPSQAGPDRLANAVAVKNLHGSPAIVVDLGTSTNFDVVDLHGDYIGGAIAPGVKTSSAELFRRASRLFPVELEKPDKAIGKNSANAMKSGIFYGSLGLIDHITSLIIAELAHTDIKVIATGGYAELFAPHSKYIQSVDPLLTLKGILMAYERNQ